MARIVIIIPTYNEAENIGRMLDVLVKEELPQVKNHTVNILVVDSKSPDGTGKIVRDRMKKYKQVDLIEPEKGGLGADYVKGMKYAMNEMKADAVIEFDADFQHDPKDIKQLIQAMDKGADHVIGSRYIPGGGIPKEWGLHRKFMSFFGSLFARTMFLSSVHDLTSGMKLTKTAYLKKVDLDHLLSKYYAYKIHITHDLLRLGAHTVEIPIIFYERKEGTSKISRKDLIDSFLVVVKLRLRDSKRFIKFGVVGLVGYTVNALGLKFFAHQPLTENIASHFQFLKLYGPLVIGTYPSSWASALGAELAILSNFLFNNFWTFSPQRITNPFRLALKFFQFNLGSLGAVLIQFAVVGAAVHFFGSSDLVQQSALVVAVGCFVVPFNYSVYNLFIWKTWKIPGLTSKTAAKN